MSKSANPRGELIMNAYTLGMKHAEERLAKVFLGRELAERESGIAALAVEIKRLREKAGE